MNNQLKPTTHILLNELPLMEQTLEGLMVDNRWLKNPPTKFQSSALQNIKLYAESELNAKRTRYYRTLGRFSLPEDPEADEIFGAVEIPPKDVLDRMLTLCKQIAKISRENLELIAKQNFLNEISTMEQTLESLLSDNQKLKQPSFNIQPSDLSNIKLSAETEYYRTLSSFSSLKDFELEMPSKDMMDKLLTLCKQIGNVCKENIELANKLVEIRQPK